MGGCLSNLKRSTVRNCSSHRGSQWTLLPVTEDQTKGFSMAGLKSALLRLFPSTSQAYQTPPLGSGRSRLKREFTHFWCFCSPVVPERFAENQRPMQIARDCAQLLYRSA